MTTRRKIGPFKESVRRLLDTEITSVYRKRLVAFLRLCGQLVDRFEKLAVDCDGRIDTNDEHLIRIFRAKRDELML